MFAEKQINTSFFGGHTKARSSWFSCGQICR